MQRADLVDYALPLIVIERYAKQIHDLCLEHKYAQAQTLVEHLCVEGRLLKHILHMMDDNQRRKHANTKEISAG